MCSLSSSQAGSWALAERPTAIQSVLLPLTRLVRVGGRGTVTVASLSGAKRCTTLAAFMFP